MAITFRQLRYFLVLAEELHFGRAAGRLHISQPPLSASLRQLEEELAVQLLERSSKHVALTRAGEVFRQQARHLLGQLKDSTELVRKVAESASGVIRVGFTPAMLFRRMPTVLRKFRNLHPGVDIQLQELNSAEQVEALTLERIDVGFIHAMPLPPSIATLSMLDEPFVCCLPAHHPLGNRESLILAELIGEPMVLFKRELAPHYYDRITGLFHAAGLSPSIRHEVSHWLTIVALIANGVGVSLVPRSLSASGFSSVSFVPLSDVDARHQSYCIWLRDTDDPRRDLFLDTARAIFASR